MSAQTTEAPDPLAAEREKWARVAERRASEIFEGSFTDWNGKHEAKRALLWLAEQLRRGR